MIENPLTINENKLKVVKPVIKFEEYKRLLDESKEVADFINSIELDEENVKEVKKILANANKSIKALNDKRISIKKEIMEPYEVFNNQIKDIEKIVKDANERLRFEVNLLKEKERDAKEEEIRKIWESRIVQYDYAQIMTFADFIEAKYLNKSYSINKVEDEMINFLEKSENDLKILCARDDMDEAIHVYKDTRDLGMSLNILQDKEKEREEYRKKLNEVGNREKVFAFTIKGEKDKKFVEMLLKENKIEYQVKEI